jgi:hypothetical protein
VETVITPTLLQNIYRVDGRIERCSRLCPHVIIDGPLGHAGAGSGFGANPLPAMSDMPGGTG